MKLAARLKRIAAEIVARTLPERRWPRIVIPGPESDAMLAALRAAGVDLASALPRPGEKCLYIPDRDERWDDEGRSDAAAGEG